MILSEFRGMWLFAMFDLPTTKPHHRKAHAQFRSALLNEGFSMMQYSVYSRYCGREEIATRLKRELSTILPEEGQVRLLAVTDHQFGKMEVFFGKIRGEPEPPPEQLLFF